VAKAIALLSGGLDSTLAVLLLRKQGIDVTAVTFLMHFGCDIKDSSSCSSDAASNASRYGFEVKLSHLGDKFTRIVKNPRYGHGKNMNPCIDCRILMLKEAGGLMEMTGADFVATGEVLGQRPMSQRRETLPMIDREAGLEGYVLRPLSAKLLKPTVPEVNGLVKREMLCGFSGRSRKPQMALAEELGLREYPAPAGGCLLTDPCYSYRLKDLLSHTPDPGLKDLHLLRVGRHFRLPGGVKAVVGRNDGENTRIKSLADDGDCLIWVEDYGSPLTVINADTEAEDILSAASLCARYSDAKHLNEVEATISGNGSRLKVRVKPAEDSLIDALRVQNAPKAR
jgi:hypothetical protein